MTKDRRTDVAAGLEGLSPEKRALLARRLKQKGLDPDALALSFAQERLWFLDQLTPGNPFYNVPVAVALRGRLDVPALQRALVALAKRHQTLRTRFPSLGGRPVQWVSRPSWPLPVVDLSALPEKRREAEVTRQAAEESAQPFDLARGPVARSVLLRQGAEEHALLVTLHHIVSDGWSMGVLVREVAALYQGLASGGDSAAAPPRLPELPIQYVDFAAWQRRWLTGEVWDRQMGYWRERLAGVEPLALPLDRRRPSVQRFRGGRVPLRLGRPVASGVRRLGQERGATPFMALLALFGALLSRASGQGDVAVGTPIANRNRGEIEGLIGFFVNSLVLRLDTSDDPTVSELVERAREVALGAYAHQDLPFEKLVEELQPERSSGHNPLFQVVFALQNAPVSEISLPGLTMERLGVDIESAKFDLKLDLWEVDGGLQGVFQYDTDLFERSTVERWARHFEALAAEAAAHPERRVGKLSLLAPAELHLVRSEWNGTAWPEPSAESLMARLAAQVGRSPDATAVVYEDGVLTYGELWRRALTLAGRLRAAGVETGELVGLSLERSLDLVVAVAGVLAAGAAYVPLDPRYPEERVAFVVEDAGLRWVVASEDEGRGETGALALPDGCRRVAVDGGPGGGRSDALSEPVLPPAPSPAYVIYTSGSTGRPKGVVVPHGQAVRLFDATDEWFGFGPGDTWTLFHSYAFDFSVWEIWGALLYGGRLVVVPYWVSREAERYHDLLLSERATVVNQTPSAFQQLLAVERSTGSGLPAVRWVVFGGEALELSSLHAWWDGELPGRLVNMYGITETTVHVTHRRLGPEDAGLGSRVGEPIPDLRVYVADPRGALCPVGVAGELLVGGAGVAPGYLGRPALTAERFVPDPWSGVPGGRLYRSGDLGRWTAGGDLEHLGRIDHQVKIRGFRIEPGEIEAALRGHQAVGEVAVIARDGVGVEGASKELVAYVVPSAAGAAGDGGDGSWSGDHVERWLAVFDQTYGTEDGPAGPATGSGDPTFNLAGWTSAETADAIPPAEMREWLDETVAQILEHRPRRVLEIGCGTGMILFRVAPEAERYVGTDLSTASLEHVGRHVDRLGLDQVELRHQPGDDFEGLEPGSFDAVVLNSVVQYFPDVEYLERVLRRAVELVAPGGFVLVGDLRSLPLLPTQHLARELDRPAGAGGVVDGAPVSLLEQRAGRQAAQETELVVAPELFAALAERVPEISRVEIAPKWGRSHNELTRFRYQALLWVGDWTDPKPGTAPHDPEPRVDELDWSGEGLGLEALGRLLETTRPEELLLRSVPNARLARQAALARLVAAPDRPVTVGALRGRLAEESGERGVEPEALRDLAARHGYRVALGWASPGTEGRFDAVFRRTDLSGRPCPPAPSGGERRPLATWANSPRRGLFLRRLAPRLREHVESHLPAHMVPSAFVMLDALPVTPQGKLDRRALPAPEWDRTEVGERYVAPRTATEEALARIWSDVLGVERVGVEDDFFHLGGHSLLATQVMSRMREELEVEVPLRALFETPTIAGLTPVVEALLRQGGTPVAPPIRRRSRGGPAPLSFAQERLWFLDRLLPGGSAYNEAFALLLEGALDAVALERALAEIIRRHESLRTRFAEIGGRPVQLVGRAAEPPARIDLTALPDGRREAELDRVRRQQARRGFDLERGPLVRLALVRLAGPGPGDVDGRVDRGVDGGAGAGGRSALLATLHHIVFDGWSTGVLVGELSRLYRAFVEGRPSPLPEPELQYADFAAWQRDWLRGEVLERHLELWRERLSGAPPLELPTDRPRPAVQRFRGGKVRAHLPEPLAARLRAWADATGTTLFMVLLAGFQALLARLSGQTDVVVGSPVANRDRGETEGMIGFFVNMLVLRADLGGETSFAEHLAAVKEAALSAYAHQALPFERIVEELDLKRDLARNPLFQVVFQLHRPPVDRLELPGVVLRPIEEPSAPAKFDLDLSMVETAEADGDLTGSIAYDRDLFDETTVRRLGAQYRRLLAAAVDAPELGLSELPLLDRAERLQVVAEWNDTAVSYPMDADLAELFEAQAASTPDAVALVSGVVALTYGELDRRADRLALRLIEAGVEAGDRVCLVVERSPEAILALVATLKAGAAYVPVDPSYPDERRAFLVADADPGALVVGPGSEGLVPDGPWPIVPLAGDRSAGGSASPRPTGPRRRVPTDGLAYVLYTSGSTGEPKGVGAVHRAVARLVFGNWYAELGPDEVVLQGSSLGFDASTLEIWGAFLHGGRLVLVPELRSSLAELGRTIARERVSLVWLTAALFEQMVAERMDDLRGVRQILAGGDVLPVAQVRAALEALADADGAVVVNGYGPTENTTFTCCHRMSRPEDVVAPVPIGRPIANGRVHVLGPDLEPVPVGVPGELCAAGDGLAQGYWRRPALTAERFVPDPFAERVSGRPGERMYRTGDRVRLLPDGRVEFLGRFDQQVKLRGFRVEPGEIEAVVAGHPAVRQAVVLVLDAEGPAATGLGERRLVAFVAVDADDDPGDLRRYLGDRLPDYMVPASVVRLDAMPRTANGKVDRRALAALDRPVARSAGAHVPPRTPTEEALAAIWSEVLEVGPVGAHDDFFDLGGHSLLATRVASRVRTVFGVDLPLRAVFEAGTLAELAAVLDRSLAGGAGGREHPAEPPIERIVPDERGGNIPLSFAQERLWFLDQYAPGNPFYNVPVAVRLRGRLDRRAFGRSLAQVARRHETLRTRFPSEGGRPVQRVTDEIWPLPVVDLSALPEGLREVEVERRATAEASRPFDLARGPVARSTLVCLGAEEHALLLTLHHIVADGWSMGVLVREVADLYQGFASEEGGSVHRPEPPVQYADFAAWQRRWLSGEVWNRQMGYWRERLAGVEPLALPLDRRRPAVQRFRGARVPVRLGPAEGAAVRRLGGERGATPFMTLLAVFGALLARLSGQGDVGVGTPIANRNRAEIEGLIGFFVNSLVLRLDLSDDPTVSELVERAREVSLGAYAHQDLPFEKLVEELQPERSSGHNPLFQVVFALQNAPVSEITLPGLSIDGLRSDNETSLFDLKLDLWEVGDGFRGVLQYDADLFERSTVERWARHFEALAAEAAAHPERRVGELSLLGPAELHLVRDEWNGTAWPEPSSESLVARLAAQVGRSPAATAVVYEDGALTYGELWRRALALAGRLRAAGVETGELVGLSLERSLDLVVAVAGVLAAGAAYVPLDPRYPEERVAFVVEDAGLRWVVASEETDRGLGLHLPDGCRRVAVDGGPGGGRSDALSEPVLPPGPSPAYVIYTSGSTGRPKGVVVPHGQAVRLFDATDEWFGFGPGDTWTLFHSYAFDFSVWEIWGALLYGGRLVVVPYWVSREAERYHDLLLSERATVVNQTPSAFQQLLAVERSTGSGLPAVRWVVFGGEALELSSLHAWWDGELPGRLVNMYGITETTVHVTHRRLGPEDAGLGSRVGEPIPDLRVYVADPRGALCPVGVAGELLVGGAGVAPGYLGRPALTAERFVPDPWSGVPGGRLYRSGDLGRWTAGGDLEHLGRIDHQVKIRGFRIEPGEIEAALRGHQAVGEVAVIARDGVGVEGASKELVAYVVPSAAGAAGDGGDGSWSGDHVERWLAVFDQTYGTEDGPAGPATGSGDPTFNLAGWTSAETADAIPPAEMREWLDETVAQILEHRPRRVLEIGCGTGMILFRVAPEAERYVGTDLSTASLEHVGRHVDRLGLDQVELRHQPGDDFEGLEPGSFDAVVLNSVVQYFPDVEYLERVLRGAVELVAPGGFVLVGDVRSLPLLSTQHLARELERPAGAGGVVDGAPVSLLEQRAGRQAAQETELVVAPDLFAALTERVPEISRVEVAPKWGRSHNELTRFRYQALLWVGDAAVDDSSTDELDGEELEWSALSGSDLDGSDLDESTGARGLDALGRLLEADQPEELVVRAIPNARLARQAALVRLLAAPERPATVGGVRSRVSESGGGDRADGGAVSGGERGVDPEALRELAGRHGYRVALGWAAPGAEGRFDAALRREDLPGRPRPLAPSPAGRGSRAALADWANSPRRGFFLRRLVPELREHLECHLPAHMVPSAFVMLDGLPVTPQGKLDRRALPAPERGRPEVDEGYVAPSTATEETLARIWAEVLGVERLGVGDDFFHLGGHSLLATQVVSRMREELGLEVPLRALFETPTVAGLASAVEALREGRAAPVAPPIRRVAREGEAPLSFAQERLWFLDRLLPGGTAYNEPFALLLDGDLDAGALDRALAEIVRRHESLRTRFPEVDGRPVQRVLDAEKSSMVGAAIPARVDLSALPAGRCEVELARLRRQQARQGFDLERGPLVRLTLVRLASGSGRVTGGAGARHALLATLHHIVFDGWSTGVLVGELSSLYGAFVEGRPSSLPEPALQYVDFATWQRDWLRGEVLERHLELWRERLHGAPPLELPTDRPRPAVQRFRGGKLPVRLPEELAEALRARAEAQGATLFMVLLAGFQALLGRLSGQTDVVIGSPIANRDRGETEGMIGFFVNMLVLRADLGGEPSFAEHVAAVRETALAAYAHQALPFERIVEELDLERDLARNPLFQVSFQLVNTPGDPPSLPGVDLRLMGAETGGAKFDLDLSLWESESGLAGTLEYDRDLFDPTTVRRLVERYERLLSAAVADPFAPLAALPVLGAAERFQVLSAWNDTERSLTGAPTLHGLVERRADTDPDALAVVAGDERLTYAELDRQANRLAHRLLALGVAPEEPVAVAVGRSVAMVVALLGVLKAGGAYLPLDPAYPRERLELVLDDSGARVLLSEEPLLDALPEMAASDGTVVCLDRLLAEEPRAAGRPELQVDPESMAYVIYTSGSTGRPKGVVVPHRAIVAFLEAMARRPGLGADDVLLAVTTLSFDIAGFDLFLPLAVGATVWVVDRETAADGARLRDSLAESGATGLQATPSTWRMLRDAGWQGSPDLRVFAGGEALPPELGDFLARTAAECWNLYGPTETTVWSTVGRVEPGGGTVSLGRPIANTRVYLLDPFGEPVPAGVAGALFIGGAGVARGYLGRPGLTAERFVPDPFGGLPGARLYSTGDLARWRSDGELEFLGRFDHQVKVRGHRIEIGEIEAVLGRHQSVGRAVVAARGSGADARLVGYVTPMPGEQPEEGALEAHLRAALPGPMVPSRIVVLDRLPLTPNGKVDRRALPDPAPPRSGGGAAGTGPRTAYEEVLAGFFAELLELPAAGPGDRFFDLGGNSLLATRLLARVRSAFGVEVPLRAVFEGPELSEIASRVEEAVTLRRGGAVELPRIEPLAPDEAPPLSYAQERLWFLDRLVPENPFYNMAAAVRTRGELDLPALAATLDRIRARQATLRARFPDHRGEPVLRIDPPSARPLPVVDLGALPEDRRDELVRELIAAEALRPFDLARGPIFRSGVLRVGSGEHLLLLTIHHVVSDGWSIGVLIEELRTIYEALAAGEEPDLPAPPVQYHDFAAWQRRWLAGETLDGQLSFWRERLAGELPPLRLPTDRPRPTVQRFRGASRPFDLGTEVSEGIEVLARREGATPFMVLLAAFQTLLSRLSGQDDLVVGTPIANRRLREVEGLVGFFVNTLAIRTDLSGAPSFREAVGRVREESLGAFAHQDIPFERLVEELQPERDTSANPIFQVFFALQNAPLSDLALGDLELSLVPTGAATTRFDLTLELQWMARGLGGSLQYSRDLFDATTVDRLGGHLRVLLEAVVADPDRSLGELPLLAASELQQVVSEWHRGGADAPAGLTDPAAPCDLAVHRLFEARAAREPDAVALEHGAERLTYRELDRRANLLAHRLRERGVGPETLVGLCVERSVEMMVAILGTLKAGGAYAALDPGVPAERLAYMIEATGSPVLVTGDPALLPGEVHRERALVLEPGWGGQHDADPGPPPVPVQSGAPAYVLFTSGSTGRPKGVVVSHGALANHMQWMARVFPIGADDAVVQKTPFSFDASVWEFYAPLLAGGRLVMARPGGHREPAYLVETIERHRATVLQCVPAQLQMLLSQPGFARGALPGRVFCGGEALTAGLRARFHARSEAELVNLYGPAEATIDSTFWACRRPRRDGLAPEPAERPTVPIGRPVDGATGIVLDARLRPVPPGVAGELCLGGAGLARGYLGRPAETAERFVPDPYGPPGARLYRTRDLVRQGVDGVLEFLGRIDGQVKLRGFRIETGEVEAALSEHPVVGECVVDLRGEGSDRRLVAWVVRNGSELPGDKTAEGSQTAEGSETSDAPVDQWQKVFDETFRATSGAEAGDRPTEDETFNIVGWNSSYTGRPLPSDEMREWVDATVERIRSLGARRVLELGCGTGLLLFRLAQECERYVGTDFSDSALAYVRRVLDARGDLPQVELEQRPANDLSGVPDGSFDLVILNSVAQYFPDLDYFLEVVDGALRVLRPGGKLFLGDLRSLPLLPAFHTSVELARAADDLPADDLKRRAEARRAEEKELVLDPELFRVLARRRTRVGHVQVLRKRGRALNEMTRFRYDVVLHVDPAVREVAEPWQDWERAGLDLASLRRLLETDGPEILALAGVPDARVAEDLAAIAELERPEDLSTARAVRERSAEAAGDRGVDPMDLWALGDALGYEVEIGDGASGPPRPGRVDALFLRREAFGDSPLVHVPRPDRVPEPERKETEPGWQQLANRPLRGPTAGQLAVDLRSFLKDRLPPYMVPSAFSVLDALPLNPSGKVDRVALPEPAVTRTAAAGYLAPRNRLERTIAEIWREVLGIDRVGVNDNFFDLGGHSLLVVQVHERLRATIGRELSMVNLFQYPTVASLVEFLTESESPEEEILFEAQARARTRREAIERRARARRGRAVREVS